MNQRPHPKTDGGTPNRRGRNGRPKPFQADKHPEAVAGKGCGRTVADMYVTHDDIVTQALAHGVEPTIAEIAARKISERSVALLGFSGKLASGKDSVAAGVVRRLRLEPALHYSFAQPLKDEVDAVLALARRHKLDTLAEVMRIDDTDISSVAAQLVRDALAADPGCDARTRTPEIRRVLQFWGTEVRRRSDYDYWVKRATRAVLQHAAQGTHVYFTDGRFPNEITGSQAIGFRVVRLEVSAEVQQQRLAARDGLDVDPVAQQHPSETALDDFVGFDLVVDNNGPFEQTVSKIVDWHRAH